ncbi:glycosyltransferase family 4 protein [Cytophaga aurantiaca]|uniref:glycosyltransferase family 4 protein n=1 Tax=Cytophaga aurantiaca TaxID=29530 RepID=UPI000370595B|nr:glycosyltransferase [Cytophaga aurantiaca]
MKKQSILLVWDRIGDYHLARVKACEKVFKGAVYTADLAGSDALYKWDSVANSTHTLLSNLPVEQKDLIGRFKAFRKIIKANDIGFVAMPYGRSEYHLFLLYAKLVGVRTLIFSESWYSRGKVKDRLKSYLLKFLGDYFFVSGARAYQHFTQNYFIDPAKIIQGYSVVDNAHFATHENIGRVQDKKQIICVARYSEEKNLLVLIKAFAASDLIKHYVLKIVGDGPLKASLKEYIHKEHLQEKVELSGWVNYKALPELYAESAAFVLASTFEPWGLVVNEAMAAGLPVILSDQCGCLPELLEPNKNGFSFNAEHLLDCTNALNKFANLNADEVVQFGNHSKMLVARLTPETWANHVKGITD